MDITRLKTLLNIDDTSEDGILTILKEHSQWAIKAYLGMTDADTFPVVLDWVSDEVTVKRYNKLSAEGLLSEGISGITHKFETDFLKEFHDILDNWAFHNTETKVGRMVML